MTLWCTISWLLSWHHVTNNNGITLKIRELSHLLPLQSFHVDVFPFCCSKCGNGCVEVSGSFFFPPFLYPLIQPSSIHWFGILPGRSRPDVLLSNNFYTSYKLLLSVLLSWYLPIKIHCYAVQPSEMYYNLTVFILPECQWLVPMNSFKFRTLICGLHFLLSLVYPTTCNNFSWHPPLISWSFLLSHTSKPLKACYPSHVDWESAKPHF